MKISRTLGASLLTATLALGPVATASASPAPAAVNAVVIADHLVKDSNRQTVIEVFDGINAFRASKGLKPLKFSTGISAVSQQWSNDMARSNDFSHNPSYTAGITTGWNSAGENIAARWDRSGQGLVDQWINSPSHNANMSHPGWQYIGIGVSYTDLAEGRYPTYSTTDFFRYEDGVVPPGTYNHPRDFFNGLPQLKPSTGLKTAKTPVAPTFDTVKRTYTIPAVEGVEYHVSVNGTMTTRLPGTYQASAGLYSIQGVAASGHELSGRYVWEATFTDMKRVAAKTPVFNRAAGTYTVPATTGVTYYVNGASKAAGSYRGNAATVKVTVKTTAGYTLTGASSWSYNFAPTQVTPLNPFVNPGTYTIPKTVGVAYYLNGRVTQPGEYKAANRYITLTAKATPGYKVSGTSSWKRDFRKAVKATKPFMSSKTNKYTIPKQAGVAFYVGGKAVKAGTYSVPNGKTLKFTAKASSSTYRLTGTKSWSYRF